MAKLRVSSLEVVLLIEDIRQMTRATSAITTKPAMIAAMSTVLFGFLD